MKELVVLVRVAILVTAGVYGAMAYMTEHVVWAPGAYATTVNGVAYAPGRFPGDGKGRE